jgi:tetratricopeptide (TPR) repeat protein
MEQSNGRDADFQLAAELAAKILHGNAKVDESERSKVLDVLEEFECWDPYFQILGTRLQNQSKRTLNDYLRVAKTQYIYLDDVFATAETCARMVSELGIEYESFIEEVFPVLFEQEDYPAEATIVQAVADKFREKNDQISAMERLCLLFEKKTFNEIQLNESYTKLLDLDPLNIKALRYFKLLFTQSYEWEKVASILSSLITASKHARDIYRVAQELAAVSLYQLDQPKAALEIMAEHGEGSPLDSSTINFDAYKRLNDWEGCLRVLRECLLNVSQDDQRATLCFRIASILEKLDRKEEATESYETAIHMAPDFFEAYEGIISILLQSKQWPRLSSTLKTAIKNCTDESARSVLREVQDRLEEGIQHVQGR